MTFRGWDDGMVMAPKQSDFGGDMNISYHKPGFFTPKK